MNNIVISSLFQSAPPTSLAKDVVTEVAKVCAGAAAGWILKIASDVIRERSGFLRSPRLASVAGTWTGTGGDTDTDGAPKLAFSLRLDLSVSGKKIKGQGKLEAADKSLGIDPSILSFEGGFYSDDFLYLTYRHNEQFRFRQIGVICFQIAPNGNLVGKYAGFAKSRMQFVTGRVTLSKVSMAAVAGRY